MHTAIDSRPLPQERDAGAESTGSRSRAASVALRGSLHAVGLVAATALVLAATYVLGWPLLLEGLHGSDSTFQLSLASWVQETFPQLGWWYPWDANGIPYREGYPLAAHWLTVALASMESWDLPQAMQVLGFTVAPGCAVGVYAFCAWRLGRPGAGLVAAVLSLLNPMAWTFTSDWGFFASQVGTVLFMPALIAVDVAASRWVAGDRGLVFRAAVLCAAGLTALQGMISPATVGGPLLALPAYVLMVTGGWRRRGLWLFVVAPVLMAITLFLTAFWSLPLRDWLSVVGSRQPPPVFSPALLPLQPLAQVFGVNGIHAQEIHDRISITPAVWLPAILGAVMAAWDRRVRVLLLIVGFALLSVCAPGLYAAIFAIPVLGNLVDPRLGWLYLQCLVPILGGLGIVSVLPDAARSGLARLRVPSPGRTAVAALLAVVGLVVEVPIVQAYSLKVDIYPHRVSYGLGTLDVRDLWSRHSDDPCTGQSQPQLCESAALTSALNVSDLVKACLTRTGEIRQDQAICAALGDVHDVRWDSANDPLIGQTQTWCSSHSDPVCAAFYQPLLQQLDPRQWRPLAVGCVIQPQCRQQAQAQSQQTPAIPGPPQRAVVDANSSTYLKNFHQLTGGGQAYSYNYQLLASPELYAYAVHSILQGDDPTAAQQLTERLGADVVVLGSGEDARAQELTRLGWTQVSSSPLVYAAPESTGPAAQWTSGTAMLVIGADQSTDSQPYNGILEQAVGGMIPASAAWFVRGRSPYLDDYSDQDLAAYPVLLLDGYRYRDGGSAWAKLDRYVRAGGRLYVETGWQWVDPDWNAGTAPSTLPVESTQWGPVDPQQPVLVDGQAVSDWGSMAYSGTGWGASSASSVRPGAQALVSEGGRVLVARWSLGRGRVVWSGMNLLAHARGAKSTSEDRFLADQWQWLLPASEAPQSLSPTWSDDNTASIQLNPSSTPTYVLFRESDGPGWSAQLSTAGGVTTVPIQAAELDFMMVRLSSIPAGAQLVFRYGPTPREEVWWSLSVVTLLLLVAWVIAPRPFLWAWAQTRAGAGEVSRRVRERARHVGADEPDEPMERKGATEPETKADPWQRWRDE